MLDDKGRVLYVGKARNLKKRVASYFRKALDTKTQSLMQHTEKVEITITASENEALLLESNLIKKLKPRFNVLLRDDKSYPYLYLSAHKDFPRLDLYRGAKTGKGKYFGPYPSVCAVRETLTIVQKLFKLRQCSEPFFKNRTRPCLQYFIKRCTAPCVNYVSKENYQTQADHAVMFLQGKNNVIIEDLADKMEEYSLSKDYEQAAIYRDQIANIRRLQAEQHVEVGRGEVDVISVMTKSGVACVQVLFIRAGRLIGNKSFFPKIPSFYSNEDVLSAFLPQFYLSPHRDRSIPRRIIVNVKLKEKSWISNSLSEELKVKINISERVRGHSRKWQQMAMVNAKHALMTYLTGKDHFYQSLEALQKTLQLPNLPQRLECFDISHTMGKETVASCVVFTTQGPVNQEYRRFNIKDITPGDDYAAIRQALTRRYKRLKSGEAPLPDILIIDGAKGQLKQAETVLEELQVSGLVLLAIAKGPSRKPGLETIYISSKTAALNLSPDSVALHVIQRIRDEAHRFAVTGHREKRAKSMLASPLEDVPGVGAKRRRELLRHFGGLQEVKKASIKDIARVPGISQKLAEQIFNRLHD